MHSARGAARILHKKKKYSHKTAAAVLPFMWPADYSKIQRKARWSSAAPGGAALRVGLWFLLLGVPLAAVWLITAVCAALLWGFRGSTVVFEKAGDAEETG